MKSLGELVGIQAGLRKFLIQLFALGKVELNLIILCKLIVHNPKMIVDRGILRIVLEKFLEVIKGITVIFQMHVAQAQELVAGHEGRFQLYCFMEQRDSHLVVIDIEENDANVVETFCVFGHELQGIHVFLDGFGLLLILIQCSCQVIINDSVLRKQRQGLQITMGGVIVLPFFVINVSEDAEFCSIFRLQGQDILIASIGSEYILVILQKDGDFVHILQTIWLQHDSFHVEIQGKDIQPHPCVELCQFEMRIRMFGVEMDISLIYGHHFVVFLKMEVNVGHFIASFDI